MKSETQEHSGRLADGEGKRRWEPMSLEYVGHVSEVLTTPGVGKSPAPSDADGLRGAGA